MFPILFFSFLFLLSIILTFGVLNGWFERTPKTDEQTVQEYFARANTAKRIHKVGKFFAIGAMVVMIFVFLYWTFGRFIMWGYYLFF